MKGFLGKAKNFVQKATENIDKKEVAKKVATFVGQRLLNKLGLNFSIEDWLKAHNEGTVEQNTAELDKNATNLAKLENMPTGLTKAVFICCNTYTRPDYSLGVGPLNDAITVAEYMKSIGFTVYYLHNPKSQEFLKYFKYFLANTQNYLVIYYTGHGASVDDTNGDEADGKDEALVFDDAFIVDDVLADTIANSGKPQSSKVCLLSDCCHSGSIYDLQSGNFKGRQMPQNVMSLSAAKDEETAKQTSIEGTDSGIFTFYFFKLLAAKTSLTPKQMDGEINGYLKKFDQNYICYATNPPFLDQTIFQ